MTGGGFGVKFWSCASEDGLAVAGAGAGAGAVAVAVTVAVA